MYENHVYTVRVIRGSPLKVEAMRANTAYVFGPMVHSLIRSSVYSSIHSSPMSGMDECSLGDGKRLRERNVLVAPGKKDVVVDRYFTKVDEATPPPQPKQS